MFRLLSLILIAGTTSRVDAVLQEGTEGVCLQIRNEPHTEYETREYSETRKEWCWDITKAFRCNVIYPRWEQVPVYRVREVKFLVCCDGWWFVDGFCQRQIPQHDEAPVAVVPAEPPVAEEVPPGVEDHGHEEEEIPVVEQAPAVEEHQEAPVVVVPEDTPAVEEAPTVEDVPRHVEEIPIDVVHVDVPRVVEEAPLVVEEHEVTPNVVVPQETPAAEEAPTAPDTEASMADMELAQALFRAMNRDSHPQVEATPVHPFNVFEEFIDTPEHSEPTDEPEPEMFPMNSESDVREFPETHWREIIKYVGIPEELRIHEEVANDEDEQQHNEHEETAPIDQRFVEHWRELIKHIANAPAEQQVEENSEDKETDHQQESTNNEQQPEPHWREIIKRIVADRPVVHEVEHEQQEAAAAAVAAHAAEEAAAAEAAAAAAAAAHRAHEGAKAEHMAAEIAGIFVKELINSLPQEAAAPVNPEPSVEHESEPPVPNEERNPEPEPLAPSLPQVQKVLEETMEDLSTTMIHSLSRLHQVWLSLHHQNTGGTRDRLETRD